MSASVIPLHRAPPAGVVTDIGPRDVYPDIVCHRCGASMRDCPLCRARDRYPLRCPSCRHDCEALPALAPECGIEQAVDDIRRAARRAQSRRTGNARVRRLAARKRAAGRCYSCAWTAADGSVHRAGLCARHYEQMRRRRNSSMPS